MYVYTMYIENNETVQSTPTYINLPREWQIYFLVYIDSVHKILENNNRRNKFSVPCGVGYWETEQIKYTKYSFSLKIVIKNYVHKMSPTLSFKT